MQHIWIDAQSFLDVKVEGTPRRMDGKMRTVWIYQRDFRSEQGIIVPHVSSGDTMARVVAFARTRGFERAFAGATRISSYRRDTWPDFAKRETGRALIIAQIDEPPGVAAAQDIVSVPGLDGVFLGQIGLTLASDE